MKNMMNEALKQGYIALQNGEVPIGAVIVKDGKIISKGKNDRETTQQAINHAEINAIKKACKKLNSWRLDDCELYVTLEPCPMCAGAILNARIKKVYFGALDTNHGAVMSAYHMLSDNVLNHSTQFEYLQNDECANIIKDFFKKARNKDSKKSRD